MTGIQRFSRNESGRDFAVGDIHGNFTRLQERLDEVGFDQTRDRLFSVGDLVDRGPESHLARGWLAKPWFHAVQGNHEDTAIRYAKGNAVDQNIYSINGGSWFMTMDHMEQKRFGALFQDMPIVIEVDTIEGIVGIVHADCPFSDWRMLQTALETPVSATILNNIQDQCQWSRRRINEQDREDVTGIHAVIVGHTPLREPAVLGNVYYIDTGGWLSDGSGYFTLIDLNTLITMPPVHPKLCFEEGGS